MWRFLRVFCKQFTGKSEVVCLLRGVFVEIVLNLFVYPVEDTLDWLMDLREEYVCWKETRERGGKSTVS